MSVTIVIIDCAKIKSANDLHDAFDRIFGFPEYYGRNMDAWIDCMSCIDDPDAGQRTAGMGFLRREPTRLVVS